MSLNQTEIDFSLKSPADVQLQLFNSKENLIYPWPPEEPGSPPKAYGAIQEPPVPQREHNAQENWKFSCVQGEGCLAQLGIMHHPSAGEDCAQAMLQAAAEDSSENRFP